MTNEELLRQSFTQDQRNWLVEHGNLDVKGTRDEKLSALAQQLHDARIYDNVDQRVKLVKIINRKGKVYDLQSFATAAGFTDQKIGNKTLTAGDQLYAAYNDPKTPDNIKRNWNVAINDVYGPGGTEFLRRRLEVEKRNREYDAQRKFDNRSTVNKILDAVVSPRQSEALAEGREPSDTDRYLDLTENVLMALPFTTGAKILGSLPRVPGIASKILRGGAFAAGTAGVPHTMEFLDSQFYTPEENLDRSIYSEGDAAIGSLTNLAAPYIANRTVSKLGRFFPRSKGTSGLDDITKAQIDQAVKDGQWEKPSKETLKSVTEFNDRQARGNAVESAMPGTHEKVAKQLETGVPTRSVLEMSRGKGIGNYVSSNPNKAQNYIEAGFIQKTSEELGMPVNQLLESGYADDILDFAETFKDANFFDLLRYKNPNASKVVDAAMESVGNYATNKYGSKRDADVILNGLSKLGASADLDVSKMLKDAKEEAKKEASTELKKSQAKQILDTQKLDAEDREWLNKLIKNPKMMEGYGEGSSSKFKNWLLIRGQDILRGTELFRPSYEVE